ncbi:hypothetical protein KQ313_14695 [Synechococcus sp. CS-1325]|uniref:hypothetical protein n=1 Tax=unclassified Synechococcus TaxID=2626047 RepID=UPI000DB6B683|nr:MULTISPECIES: hypothetical protein [unclassified Synechococcus]PZU97525.1 MAG: hypothetical protein DCF24_12295 [Cyanobium sp.]MCT0200919.1 hypothetical protein [Synechococcus sp. CS-1325]MCT0212054.1 hypothetical protein [Synechococcus sp. CS-1326]MCT0230507.1 hypothetical protein [Synechococcus sp. CS-1324]MCT0234174.1 hypothetical protein [Synechococcus sp. CS-1327]
MTNASPPGAASTAALKISCPSCGGSGVLRMSDQRFRTCLDCLGQGHLPVFEPQPSLQALIQRQEDQAIQPSADGLSPEAVSSGSR